MFNTLKEASKNLGKTIVNFIGVKRLGRDFFFVSKTREPQ
jgi:hypothetical protein